jgi:hypothetical protein
MEPQAAFTTFKDFIELHRTFHELSEHGSENEELELVRSFGSKSLQWSDLLKEYRLVILSEAGSGKTAEIRNIAQTLRTQGLPAFFLRLEHIAQNFEIAFEVGTFESFEEWQNSRDEGWLFLDSVDEARLQHPGDFELAIRKLGKRIKTVTSQTHIALTSRTTVWRPKTDLALCITHFPFSPPDIEEDCRLTSDESSGGRRTKNASNGEDKSVFRVVAFDDLSREQIAIFVRALGVKDSTAFIDAVERADAWSFTSRPQDLEELIEFWLDKGRIGTRLEIMRNSIARRLTERDQDRADVCPLSSERARQGVRLLAAAATLTKNQTIRVPDGAANSMGIIVRSVLLNWNEKEQAALLSRPIFDEAIYGTVRFHHRSVREYLTAEWFAELLKRETTRRNIETLFFRNQYGLDIVVPSIRSILPWLAILDDKIGERVCRVAPEVILEGGDPSQLPVEVRRSILRKVCEQMISGLTNRSVHDYAAVQRFAQSDLTDDVRELIGLYGSNDELTAFLFRMVWIGQLTEALPEAMKVALTPTVQHYTRIVAFRAIKAIGTKAEQECVRQFFLTEADELEREWLAELIKGTAPTAQTLDWLLAVLEKSEPKGPYSVDSLAGAVTEFVDNAEINLLPPLVAGFNRLLSFPPLIDRRFCKVSENFFWILMPASKAIERLILERHPASLEPDSIEILHKISMDNEHDAFGLSEVKSDFARLVPAWQELNRALFWSDVQHSRAALDEQRGERRTNFWQASIFGAFWRFDIEDFDFATQEIARQPFQDDKLVALSLAFHLYKEAHRPKSWRVRLKKLTAGNLELAERLQNCLRPPAQDQESRHWKLQEKKWKKRHEVERKKREQYHSDWKQYLNNNLGEVRAVFEEQPGTIPNALFYLFEQTRNNNKLSGRWTEYNWQTLIPEFGEEIAQFYRDSVVSFWRNYSPQLRSEGFPFNETPDAVIFGLAGLEIETHETQGWPKSLRAEEVKLACKYASFELNGFPSWFPQLFEMHPEIVCEFLLGEVRYELSIEKPETAVHYIISDLSYSGQWAWDRIGPCIFDILNESEPENLSSLENLLKMLQCSSLSDEQIAGLALQKYHTLTHQDHVACWFAVWTGVAPGEAITAFKTHIGTLPDAEEQTHFAMVFLTHLLGGRFGHGVSVRHAFKAPEHLKSLYLLMHDYIRSDEDIHRAGKGAYSPGLRDNAQDARESLLNLLIQIPGKESFSALMAIAKDHPEEGHRPWILLRTKAKAEQDGDMVPWMPQQVREFHEKLDRTPGNHKELAELAVLRLLDLKDDFEHGDQSISNILLNVRKETDMRTFIGRELREKSLGRYSIPPEEELADAKRPDLRFHGVGFDGPVPVELKLADNWSGPDLFERLENQLCGDYLRDSRSSRGIFLIVYRGEKKGWKIPDNDHALDFSGLVVALQEHWNQISTKFQHVDDITVVGIDLTLRSRSREK